MSIINDKSRLCHATFNNRMAKNVGAEQMYNSLSHTHTCCHLQHSELFEPISCHSVIWEYSSRCQLAYSMSGILERWLKEPRDPASLINTPPIAVRARVGLLVFMQCHRTIVLQYRRRIQSKLVGHCTLPNMIPAAKHK